MTKSGVKKVTLDQIPLPRSSAKGAQSALRAPQALSEKRGGGEKRKKLLDEIESTLDVLTEDGLSHVLGRGDDVPLRARPGEERVLAPALLHFRTRRFPR